MVCTQFQEKLQIFRSDNGMDSSMQFWVIFSYQKGIVHQSSCNDAPQQSGAVEHRNSHILEARASCFTSKIPKHL